MRSAFFALWTLLLVPSLAHAEGGPDLLSLGKQEYETGQKEFNLGHYEKALEHFETSYRLTARPALLFNLGYVHRQLYARTRKLEYLDQAIERFTAYLASTRSAEEPQVKQQRERVERELKSAVEERAREQAARAQGEASLSLGEELLTEGRLAEARAQLERFQHTPANERPGVVRALVLAAGLAVAEGKPEEAAAAYAQALSLDRSVTLAPGAPEAARAAFANAEKQLGPNAPVAARHTPPGSLKPGAPVELVFTLLSDPAHVTRGLELSYRAGGGAFSTMPVGPVGKVALPPLFSQALLPGAKLEYYANLVDGNGAILQHLGTASLPFSLEVERPRPPGLAKKAWFWSVMAGVAAVVATGIGVGVYLGQPAPPVHVPISLSSTTLRLP